MKHFAIIVMFIAALVCLGFGVAQAEDTTDQLEMCYTLNDNMNEEYNELYKEYDELFAQAEEMFKQGNALYLENQQLKQAMQEMFEHWVLHNQTEHPSL